MSKNKNSLVWQITPPDALAKNEATAAGSNSSYILGTMHVRDARAFQFEHVFYEKIMNCTAFATEFNLDDAQKDMGFSLTLVGGVQLSQLIKPKTFEKISRVVQQKMGVPLTHFNNLKPIIVTNMLTESVLSSDRMMSLDETLWRFASENGRILRGIETFDEQVDILNRMTWGDQIKGLKDLVSNFSKFRKQLLRMAALYEKAEIQKLYKAAKRTTKGSRRLLLFDRNEIMAQRIADLSSEMTLCAAIGAGHLAGKKGVLNLLKNKGFEVKPVFE
jgi:uncharacterized protein